MNCISRRKTDFTAFGEAFNAVGFLRSLAADDIEI